jgi:hypothetical protein
MQAIGQSHHHHLQNSLFVSFREGSLERLLPRNEEHDG